MVSNSEVTHLVVLTRARIIPAYIWEAFSPPYAVPLLISPKFPVYVPWSLDQTAFYHPKWCSVSCKMSGSISSDLCLYLVRLAWPDRRLGVSLGYRGTFVVEQSTLPILNREGNLSPCRVLSWICLLVDLIPQWIYFMNAEAHWIPHYMYYLTNFVKNHLVHFVKKVLKFPLKFSKTVLKIFSSFPVFVK